MRLPRGLLVLAIVAALWGAPSSVSAAVNELSSAQVSPGSGSVVTVFTFRVRYEGAFPATSVSVSVAGLTVPMLLESGSLTAGWWSGVSMLPVGAWSTSFRATAAKGPSPAIDGPIVTVAAPFTPPPASAGPTPQGAGSTPESAPVGDPDDATAPPAAPAPGTDEVPATAAAAATATPAAEAQEPAAGASGGSGANPDGPAAAPEPGAAEPGAAEPGAANDDPPAEDGAPAASSGGTPDGADGTSRIRTAASEARDASSTADEMVSALLLLGLAGVASVAIVGTLLLLAARRREPDAAPATASAVPPAVEDAAMRRVARPGRTNPADDPIVAALGVDDEMAARRAIRRAGVKARHVDEPPARRPRRR